MEDVNDLRRKYMDNPPEGYIAKEIERMSDEDILDIDYYLNNNFFLYFKAYFIMFFRTFLIHKKHHPFRMIFISICSISSNRNVVGGVGGIRTHVPLL